MIAGAGKRRNRAFAVGRLQPELVEALRMMSWGYNDDEIAECFGISRKSISNYTTRIFEFYGAHSRPHAVAMALRKGDIK